MIYAFIQKGKAPLKLKHLLSKLKVVGTYIDEEYDNIMTGVVRSDGKKIGVIGMGPVGMILSAKLIEAGWDVSVCVRDKIKFNLIKNHGLELEGVFNSVTPIAQIYGSIGEMLAQEFDYLVFALKSYQITAAAEEVRRMHAGRMTVISAQNGIDVGRTIASCIRCVIGFEDGNQLRREYQCPQCGKGDLLYAT